MNYNELLDDLETMQKGYKAKDEAAERKIREAAELAEASPDDEAEPEDENENEENELPVAQKKKRKAAPEDEDEGNPFAKSFIGTTEDGQDFEAIDGTDLLKSMSYELEALRSEAAEEKDVFAKSFAALAEVIKSQDKLLKTLSANVAELSNAGRGRRTVLSIAEKPVAFAKSQPAALSSGELMTKCLSAQKSGRISAFDVSRANIALESGLAVPADVLSRLAE